MNDIENKQSDPYLLLSFLVFVVLLIMVHLVILFFYIKLIEYLYPSTGNIINDFGNGLYAYMYTYVIIYLINIISSISLSVLYYKKYVKKYSRNRMDNYTISILLVSFNIFILLPRYMEILNEIFNIFCFH